MSGGNLVVVGLDVAAIAASARRSGYEVYAVDYFGDRDTQASTQMNYALIRQAPQKSCGRISECFSPSGLVELVRKLAQKYPLDGILLASGLEDSNDELRALMDLAPIVGNSPDTIARVRNKVNFFGTLKRRNICCPETVQAKGVEEIEQAARELGYPVVLKKTKSFGGEDVNLIQDNKALRSAVRGDHEVLVQEYIQGIPASASITSTERESVVLSINEQILGVQQLGASGPFIYCGNIVPLVTTDDTLRKCRSICTQIAATFGLIGSNGIDFVLDESGQPWVVEVNPRFQGTIECVEKMLGINLVEAHMTSCKGRQIVLPQVTTNYCTRLVLYGRQRCSVPDLAAFTEARDIPFPGVIIERGEPVCSVVTEGKTKLQSVGRANELAGQIYDLLTPK